MFPFFVGNGQASGFGWCFYAKPQAILPFFHSDDFGTCKGDTTKTFRVNNLGTSALLLSGSPAVQISGENADEFTVSSQPASSIAAGAYTQFNILFSPTTSGGKTAGLTIPNNDSNENPYIINLVAYAQIPSTLSLGYDDRSGGASIAGVNYNEDISANQSSIDLMPTLKEPAGPPSVGINGTYYIYSYDGKLLAEYNGSGQCVRDYVYMGNKLIAEYRAQEGVLYYYASDQINSTRMVTNSSGTVVYSATHDPYGGVQKTWVNTYEPELKFSGKERDAESGLDYFGARYYANNQYRWISIDPIIDLAAAMRNPQSWNLYEFCRNSPINLADPDGQVVITPNQEGYHTIQRSIGDSELAKNISWNSGTGEISAKNIQTDNENYNSLAYLCSLSQEIYVSIAGDISFMDATSGKTYSTPLSENGVNGITIFPKTGRSGATVVHDGINILVVVARDQSNSKQAKTMAHELYGHAYLYMSKKPFLHEMNSSGTDALPDGYVNSYIRKIEEKKY